MKASAGTAVLVTVPVTNGKLEPAETRSTGWDPYEVWRTRVLLPRLKTDGRVTLAAGISSTRPRR